MQREHMMRFGRLAGQVLRYHTWPVHRPQSVGEHTWQVLRIWIACFGLPIPEVAGAIVWHDGGELHTGDMPYPFKASHPKVKMELDTAEVKAVESMGYFSPVDLSDYDHLRIKICDLLDMHEYGLTELHMGNQFACPVIEDTLTVVRDLMVRLVHNHRAHVRRYLTSVHKRFGYKG